MRALELTFGPAGQMTATAESTHSTGWNLSSQSEAVSLLARPVGAPGRQRP